MVVGCLVLGCMSVVGLMSPNIHAILNLAGIAGYIFALVTGLMLASHMREMTQKQAVAVVGSITTSFCFVLLIMCWTATKGASNMPYTLAVSFEMTHIFSSVAIAMYHINAMDGTKWNV